VSELDSKIADAERAVAQARQVTGPVLHTQPWDPKLIVTLSGMLLIFALLVFFLMFYLIRANKRPESVLRVFGTLLIIVVACFLIIVGFGNDQLAPVMGLLGTIAGYLLGRNTISATGDAPLPAVAAPVVMPPALPPPARPNP
jgi:hypothetical protein